MKSLQRFLRVSLFVLFLFACQPGISQAALTDNMLGYWSFNSVDISGSTLYDVSNTCPTNGTFTGTPTATTGHFSDANGARTFNGTTHVATITAGNGSVYDFATSNFTVSVWVKTSTTSAGTIIAAYNTTAGDLWAMRLGSSTMAGKIYFEYSDATNVNRSTATSTATINNNAWHHVVGVRDGLKSAKIYVDGVLVGSSSPSGVVNSVDITSNVFIGNVGTIPTSLGLRPYSGDLDDITVFNRALSASEVATLYSTSAATEAAWRPSVTITAATSTAAMLNDIGAFRITRGTSLACTLPITFAVSGTAAAGTDYTSLGTTATILSGQTSVDVSVTPLANVVSSKTVIVTLTPGVRYTGSGNATVTLHPMPVLNISAPATGNIAAVTWSTSNVTSCTLGSVPSGFSASGTSGAQNHTMPQNTVEYGLTCVTPVGTKIASTTATNGNIITNLRTGLIHYWTFDSGTITGTSAADKSPGMCGPVTTQNTPTANTGHYGDTSNALLFNGVDQSLQLATSSVRLADGTFSISAWVKPSTVLGTQFIDADWNAGYKQNYYLALNGSAVNFRVGNGGNNNDALMTGGTLVAGNWYHIVATVNGTVHKIYVNGAEVATQTGSYKGGNTADYDRNQTPIDRWIGTSGSADFFSGTIDEVMHYNRALTPTEISALYTLSAVSAATLQAASSTTAVLYPVVETTPSGYTFAAFKQWAKPAWAPPTDSTFNNYNPWWPSISNWTMPWESPSTQSATKNPWIDNSPSPQTCHNTVNGSCLYFGQLEGTRIAMLKATSQITSGSSSTLGNGLVGYWSLDTADISGTTAYDVSGQGNDGVLLNTPTAVNPGKINQGMNFNKNSNEGVNLGTPNALNFTTSFSIGAWIKPTDFGSNSRGRIFSKSGPNSGYTFGLDNQNISSGLAFYINDASPGEYGFSNNNAVTTGVWQFATVVYNATTSIVTFYINGVAVGSDTLTATPLSSSAETAYIGRMEATDRNFNGDIDEVMIFNRALFAGEVAQIYSLTASTISQVRPSSANTITPVYSGIDLIASTTPPNLCGIKQTHWLYARNNTVATMYVPKYSTVKVDYACQPNQDYFWKTEQDGNFSYDSTATEQRIFRFADKSKIDGTPSSLLYTTKTVSVANSTTFSLNCGGYLPEEGTVINLRPRFNDGDGYLMDDFNMANDSNDYVSGYAHKRPDVLPDNIGLPPYYAWGTKNACGSYCYWRWSWTYFNIASSTYYHPATTLDVQACAANEIVDSGGSCQACGVGEYVSGNSCVSTAPPTASINAGAGNGVARSFKIGDTVTVRADYSSSIASGITKRVYLTSGSSWTVPTDWNSASNSVEVIGGGGGGRTNAAGRGGGGGGGGFSKVTNITLTPGASVAYSVGAGGAASVAGGATYFCNSSSNCGSIAGTAVIAGANGGTGATSDTGATGGSVTGAVGTYKYAGGRGGNGGPSGPDSGGGGGGAAGPYDAGGAGGYGAPSGTNSAGGGGGGSGGGDSGAIGSGSTGGAGGNNYTGVGGGAGGIESPITQPVGGTNGGGGGGSAFGNGSGGAGGAGAEWDSTHGSGGGGGGGADNAGTTGGAGGLYGGGGGGGRTGGSGGNGIIVISYQGDGLDSITATAINDDSTGNSVDCGLVKTFNGVSTTTYSTGSGCENNPDSNKTLTFTANTSGTITYSAQIKTGTYLNYNSYKTVTVTICPVGQESDGSGGCQVADQCTNNVEFPGTQTSVPANCTQELDGTCTAPPGYFISGGVCVSTPPVPTLNANSFTATRVRSGNASTLTWNIPGMAVGITCTITPTPASGQIVWNGTSNPWTGTAQTAIITAPTRYTLTCGNNQDPSASRSVIVNIIPGFQEI